MQRLILSLLCGLLISFSATPAMAGHWFGWRGYRHFGYRPYVRPYVHRHVGFRHYGFRSYGYRHYAYRPFVYHYPRYRYSSFSYVSRPFYYSYPVHYAAPVYYSPPVYSWYPFCSTTPRSTPVPAPTAPTEPVPAPEQQPTSITANMYASHGTTHSLQRSEESGPLVLRASYRRETGTSVSAAPSQRVLFAAGDHQLRQQGYERALREYSEVAVTESAAARVRQGCALIGAGRYDQAAWAFKRALAIDADYVESRFRLQEIYANEQAATQQIEALAAAALERTEDSDLLFLIGVLLHFQDQSDRAATFFQRAQDLSGGKDAHLRAFLTPASAKLAAATPFWNSAR